MLVPLKCKSGLINTGGGPWGASLLGTIDQRIALKGERKPLKLHSPPGFFTCFHLTEEGCPMDPGGGPVSPRLRAEVDTSAPFESVKEAATRFGGFGHWKSKPSPAHLHETGETDITKLEEQGARLEEDLIFKERETLQVLKELEATKTVVEDLKSKLQKETAEVSNTPEINQDAESFTVELKESGQEKHQSLHGAMMMGGLNPSSTSSARVILMELGQAKLNLSKTTSGLAAIRASVESLTSKLEDGRASLEKTKEMLYLNSCKILSLESDLDQTRLELQVARNAVKRSSHSENPTDISKELQRLSSEAEHFKKVVVAARSEVSQAVFQIEQVMSKIKTAEIRLTAARKMKEAARAAEAAALAEFEALSKSEGLCGTAVRSLEGVTLSSTEYSSLACEARDAEKYYKKRVGDAMLKVDEANGSKAEVLNKVEAAIEEVKACKNVLEDALARVEAANKGKLAVEEALRKWRLENGQRRRSIHNSNGQRRRSIHNSTKFKNAYSSNHRRDSRMLDVNGLNLITDGPTLALKPALSVGQILSRKLLLPEDFETEMLGERGTVKRKVSLGQMLRRRKADSPSPRRTEREIGHGQSSGKRKKFAFGGFSLSRAKGAKNKKSTVILK